MASLWGHRQSASVMMKISPLAAARALLRATAFAASLRLFDYFHVYV